MNPILLFKQDLEKYPTNSLQTLQRHFDLPVAKRSDLLWLLAIYQAQNNRQGTMNGTARSYGKYESESGEESEGEATPRRPGIQLGGGLEQPAYESESGEESEGEAAPRRPGIQLSGPQTVGAGIQLGRPRRRVPRVPHERRASRRAVPTIAGGGSHSLAILADDGTVVGWGDNRYGQIDIPEEYQDQGFVQVAAGMFHSLGILADGTVVAWGMNEDGQTDVPEEYRDQRFIQVAAGGSHSLGILADGTVVAWGDNRLGQTNIPNVYQDQEFTQVSAGGDHSLGILANGGVVAWGYGQIDVPKEYQNEEFVQVAAGINHSLGILADGTVVAWGSNASRQTDVEQYLDQEFIQIAAGGFHSLGILANGRVVAWGNNRYGQTDVPLRLQDTRHPQYQEIIQVAAGSDHSLAILADGTVVVWGDNRYGQTEVHQGPFLIPPAGGEMIKAARPRTSWSQIRDPEYTRTLAGSQAASRKSPRSSPTAEPSPPPYRHGTMRGTGARPSDEVPYVLPAQLHHGAPHMPHPFYQALIGDDADLVETMLEAGQNPNEYVWETGTTTDVSIYNEETTVALHPLIVVISNMDDEEGGNEEQLRMVQLLLEYGARPDLDEAVRMPPLGQPVPPDIIGRDYSRNAMFRLALKLWNPKLMDMMLTFTDLPSSEIMLSYTVPSGPISLLEFATIDADRRRETLGRVEYPEDFKTDLLSRIEQTLQVIEDRSYPVVKSARKR